MRRVIRAIDRFWFEPREQWQWGPFRIMFASCLAIDYLQQAPFLLDYYGSRNAFVGAEQAVQKLRLVFGNSPIPRVFVDFLSWIWSHDIWLYSSYLGILIALLMILIGKFTRVASITAFVLSFVLFCRNPAKLYLANSYASMLLLYLAVSPAGRYWGRSCGSKQTSPFVLQMVKVNISVIYLMAVSCKLSAPEWRTGVALFYALNLDKLVRFSLPEILLWSPTFIAALTYFVILIQFGLAFGVWNRRLAPYVIGGGVLFHLGIAFFLHLGIFPALCISALSLFVESESVASAAKRFLRLKPGEKGLGRPFRLSYKLRI